MAKNTSHHIHTLICNNVAINTICTDGIFPLIASINIIKKNNVIPKGILLNNPLKAYYWLRLINSKKPSPFKNIRYLWWGWYWVPVIVLDFARPIMWTSLVPLSLFELEGHVIRLHFLALWTLMRLCACLGQGDGKGTDICYSLEILLPFTGN